MVSIILVTKHGIVQEKKINDFDRVNLYKKCSFRKPDHFGLVHTFKMKKNIFIHVFAKDNGRANNENKFELPPPIDNTIYYGTIAIVCSNKKQLTNTNVVDLDEETWCKYYQKLFGGFEDLSKTVKQDNEEEDELDNYSKDQLTKNGYLKDGFVVDDVDEENDGDISEDDGDDVEQDDDQSENESDYDETDSLEEENDDMNEDEVDEREGEYEDEDDKSYLSDTTVGSELVETEYSEEDSEDESSDEEDD